MQPEQATPQQSATDIVALLASTTLFGALGESALRDVEAALEWVHLPGGATLFYQGDRADCLYIVINGRLRVTVVDCTNGERTVSEMGRGESVGEMAILTGEPRSATVRAVRDTELAKFSQAGFDRLVEKYPQMMRQFACLIVRRLQSTTQGKGAIHTVTAIAVVPASKEAPLCDFTDRLAAAFATIGPTLHLSSRRLDSALGNGAAQTLRDNARNSTIVTWLNEQEAKYQFVIYEADPVLSPWTSRCLRQADRLLLVGCADTEPRCGEIEAELLRLRAGMAPVRTELVLVHRTGSGQPSGTHRWLTTRTVDTHHHVRFHSATDFARLARFLAGHAVGLVLGGGGARGFAHIGVIRALTEADIPIDFIGGSSMGAVIAAQYALGGDYETMLALNRKGWIESRPLTDYTIPVVALIVGRRMLKMLAAMFGDTQIEDLWLPYFCVSSNLTRAEVMAHREGLLRKWLRASISVPGIGPPLLEPEGLLADGGVLNNLPADIMQSLCAGPVIAVDVSSRVDLTMTPAYRDGVSAWHLLWERMNPLAQKLTVPNIFYILVRTATLGSAHAAKSIKDQVDLYLHPPVEQFGKFEWKALEQIADVGYRYAQRAIAEWKSDKGLCCAARVDHHR